MSENKKNVLFLCTGNSARSIMAEALLQRLGADRFESYSAGSKPRGKVNSFALELLEKNSFNIDSFRSKSWDEFAVDDAPEIDFIFTVCDNAANETCPVWPGHPMTAHWGIADPDQPEKSLEEQRELFKQAYKKLEHKIKKFIQLDLDQLDQVALKNSLDEIGKAWPE